MIHLAHSINQLETGAFSVSLGREGLWQSKNLFAMVLATERADFGR